MEITALIVGSVACLGVAVLLMVLLSVRTRRRARERWAALQQWAAANEWTLVPHPQVDWSSRLPGRNPRGVTLAMAGTMWGRRVSVAEYQYDETSTTTSTDGNGNTTHGTTTTTHRFVVTVIHLPHPSPLIGVQPRSWMSKVGRAVFGAGTELGHREFDGQWRVVGDAAASPYRITPELVEAHVAGALPAWTLSGTDLIAYRPGRIDPGVLAEQAGPLLRVADLLTGSGAAAPRR